MTAEKQKSNTGILFVPLAVLFATIILLKSSVGISDGFYGFLFFLLFGYSFIGVAIAQHRSGYFWKNLAPGNRGRHKTEAPKKFFWTNLIYIVFGLIFWGIGIRCLL